MRNVSQNDTLCSSTPLHPRSPDLIGHILSFLWQRLMTPSKGEFLAFIYICILIRCVKKPTTHRLGPFLAFSCSILTSQGCSQSQIFHIVQLQSSRRQHTRETLRYYKICLGQTHSNLLNTLPDYKKL